MAYSIDTFQHFVQLVLGVVSDALQAIAHVSLDDVTAGISFKGIVIIVLRIVVVSKWHFSIAYLKYVDSIDRRMKEIA